jgi:hypothetical protein
VVVVDLGSGHDTLYAYHKGTVHQVVMDHRQITLIRTGDLMECFTVHQRIYCY